MFGLACSNQIGITSGLIVEFVATKGCCFTIVVPTICSFFPFPAPLPFVFFSFFKQCTMLAFLSAPLSFMGYRSSATEPKDHDAIEPPRAVHPTANANASAKPRNKAGSQEGATNFTYIHTSQSLLYKSHLPLTYYIIPQVATTPTTAQHDSPPPNDAPRSPHSPNTPHGLVDNQVPEITPILHPNEVILQRFPHKASMKRVSELRLASSSNGAAACSACPESRLIPQSHRAIDLFRSDVISGCSLSDRRTNEEDTHHPRRPMTLLTPLSPSPRLILESDHDYLTRAAVKGTVYVTSERLLFLPNSAKYSPKSLDAPPVHELEFDMAFSAIDTMRVIESSQGKWFFVCYSGIYMSTLGFTSESRAQSFLKLVANVRFENMIRESLPPKYVTPLQACCAEGQMPFCCVCAAQDLADWNAEDGRLPTYAESEEAVRQYLIKLNLLAKDSPPFDRHNPSLDILGMLSLACSSSIDDPVRSAPLPLLHRPLPSSPSSSRRRNAPGARTTAGTYQLRRCQQF